MTDRRTRRRVLESLAVVGAGAGAGCRGGPSEGNPESGSDNGRDVPTTAAATEGTGTATGTDDATNPTTRPTSETAGRTGTVVPASVPAGPSSFPSYRADAGNTGHVSGANGPSEDPTVASSVRDLWSPLTATVANGRAYFTSSGWDGDPNTFCFDVATGERLWEYDLGRAATGPPTVATVGETAMAFAYDLGATVHAVDAETGERRWTAAVGDETGVRFAPVLAGDAVVVVTKTAVVGLSPADGRELWTAAVAGEPAAAPAADGGSVYVPCDLEDAGRVVAIDATSGAVRWRATSENVDVFAPTVADGAVYVPGDGMIEEYAAADGSREAIVESGAVAPVAVADGSLYHVQWFPRKLVRTDLEDGTERWATRVGGREEPSAPTVGESSVYLADGEASVVCFDRESGERAWTRTFDGSDVEVDGPPALVDGRVIVSTDDSGDDAPSVVVYE